MREEDHGRDTKTFHFSIRGKVQRGELLCKSLLSRWKVSKSWAVCGTPTDATPVTHQSLLNWEMQEATSRKLSKKLHFALTELACLKGRAGWGGAPWQVAWKFKPGTAGTKSGVGCERTAGSQAYCELHLKVGWSKALIPLLCSSFLFLFLHFLLQSNIFNRFSC